MRITTTARVVVTLFVFQAGLCVAQVVKANPQRQEYVINIAAGSGDTTLPQNPYYNLVQTGPNTFTHHVAPQLLEYEFRQQPIQLPKEPMPQVLLQTDNRQQHQRPAYTTQPMPSLAPSQPTRPELRPGPSHVLNAAHESERLTYFQRFPAQTGDKPKQPQVGKDEGGTQSMQSMQSSDARPNAFQPLLPANIATDITEELMPAPPQPGPCVMCCIPDEVPCSSCCDFSPFLNVKTLKSTAG